MQEGIKSHKIFVQLHVVRWGTYKSKLKKVSIPHCYANEQNVDSLNGTLLICITQEEGAQIFNFDSFRHFYHL